MQTFKTYRIMALGLLVLLLGAALAGCGARDTQAPTGMKVGPPLTAAQIAAIKQKRLGNMQQRQQGQ